MRAKAILLILGAVLLLAADCLAGGLEYWRSGLAAYQARDWEKATILLTKAIEAGDLDRAALAKLHTSRGVVWRIRGDLDRAIEDHNQALKLDPQLAEAYCNRGNVWRKKGDYYRSMADYAKALEVRPDHAPAFHGVAWLMATAKEAEFRNGEAAVEMARKALALVRNANHLDTLAAALAEAGRFQEAVEAEKEALRLLQEEGDQYRLESYKKRLAGYLAGRPWRE